jgi:hypothetical protein
MCGRSFAQPRGKLIEVTEAIGTMLAHDMTEIRRGEYKGPAFKKGHVVRERDVAHLARLGKRHVFVLDLKPGMMHEDDAVLVFAAALAGQGVTYNPHPAEGKINLTAAHDGLLKVDVEALIEFNEVDDVMCASRHTNTMVRAGDIVAGTRAIPLVIADSLVEQAARVAKKAGGIFSVKPLAKLPTGLIVTGNEVYSGLIEDKFVPVITPKMKAYDCPVLKPAFCPDDPDFIAETAMRLIDEGARLLVTTGGMSVDPDDVTRLGIIKAGATDILYGSAVLPGAMLLLAHIDRVPVIGVPACGMFHDQTIFDLVLPRVLAGETLTRRDLAKLAHGGLCLNCPVCRFPQCSFGKSG